eukprot:GHVU01222714.1.p5 GENE.GHVU01222714.1~~GHVU01222714.1.p5  ORF type:complete len:120 (-),score=12.79 GHVU01222714.1:359-718(-)
MSAYSPRTHGARPTTHALMDGWMYVHTRIREDRPEAVGARNGRSSGAASMLRRRDSTVLRQRMCGGDSTAGAEASGSTALHWASKYTGAIPWMEQTAMKLCLYEMCAWKEGRKEGRKES